MIAAAALADLIKAQAYGLGFDLAGVTSLGPAETAETFDEWIRRGFAGEMEYLPRGAAKRRDTRLPYEGSISAIVVGLNYGGTAPAGPIARYARGDDYHDVMWGKLDSLHMWIEGETGRKIRGRSYVDTGPILERELARRAGLGWFGRNTNLINPKLGSFFFIGALFVDLYLEPDAPFEADRCGTCRKCLDACPTNAFVESRVLDATRCISYLTIESRSAIPVELRDSVGELIYGCDICQDVCPWNESFARGLSEASLAPRDRNLRDARTIALEIISMDDDAFRSAYRNSAMKRAKLRGLKRNAAVALGNVGTPDDVASLAALAQDADPMIREHGLWAVNKISSAKGQNSACADDG